MLNPVQPVNIYSHKLNSRFSIPDKVSMKIIKQLPCACKVNTSWPFLVSVCKHGNHLVNKAPKETKKQELSRIPDALM